MCGENYESNGILGKEWKPIEKTWHHCGQREYDIWANTGRNHLYSGYSK